MSTEHDSYRDELAAFALGALEPAEAERFAGHLESCVLCRDELASMRSVTDLLPLVVAQHAAPPPLRARILQQVSAEAPQRGTSGAAVPRARMLRLVDRLNARAAPTARRPRAPRGSPILRPLAGIGALAVAVLVGALLFASTGSKTDVSRASVASAAAWPDRRVPVVMLERTGSHGQLLLSHLPPAPRGRIYEVWVERGGVARPTDALFDATSSGRATVAVPGDLAGAEAVLVTIERLGGSRVPTMAPLITARTA